MSIGDIELAILAGNISDKSIDKDSFEKNDMGELILSSGNFAVVFRYRKNGIVYSFRCWYKENEYVERLCQRWNIISNCLKSLSVDYLSTYNYDRCGISINNKKYPVLTTKWIVGDNLLRYVYNNRSSINALNTLAERFLKIFKDMNSKDIAHGDLQHGNILVEQTGKIHFIDYDSFYFPELKGNEDVVQGLPSYQHPARFTNKYSNEKIDYFSQLIIYLGILAVAKKPELAELYHLNSKNTEYFLFDSKDFANLKYSKIYHDIKSLNSVYLDKLLSILDLYLKKDSINDLEPFWTLLENNTNDGLIDTFFQNKKHRNNFCNNCGKQLTETEVNFCNKCNVKRGTFEL
ncbi:MAG: hypothetical protein IJ748_03015 [Bacteroidales bacterium]|nr:hypothetical protein [Bacteroidales bacterium]